MEKIHLNNDLISEMNLHFGETLKFSLINLENMTYGFDIELLLIIKSIVITNEPVIDKLQDLVNLQKEKDVNPMLVSEFVRIFNRELTIFNKNKKWIKRK